MTVLVDWRPSSSASPLRAADLHLWRIRTDHRGADPRLCLALLEARQQRRAEGMRHQAYRDRYVRAQAGLRQILSFYLGRGPNDIRFEYGEAGKPRLPSDLPEICFNLTTSGDLALAALSFDSEIGIDCERIRPGRDIDGIACRMFDPKERQAIADAPEPDRLDRFFRAWTAMEADAKADGRGLFRTRAPEARKPQVVHCIPERGYIAAVAGERLPPPHAWAAFDFDGLGSKDRI